MDFTHLVGTARVVQDAFRDSGLAGINVGNDTDVAHLLSGEPFFHRRLSGCRISLAKNHQRLSEAGRCRRFSRYLIMSKSG
jgi:hypothetical protein